ncbi:MAG TPA: hypothetical protein PK090_00830 [Smithellaceae bacterium]|nr:hypothetical protein [Smithellaceae bacterium]
MTSVNRLHPPSRRSAAFVINAYRIDGRWRNAFFLEQDHPKKNILQFDVKLQKIY